MLSALSLFRKPRYKSFSEEVNGRKLISRSYKGTRPIDVNKVVGSVGRCQNGQKECIDKHSQRYQNIKKALQNLQVLPAIKVYVLDNEYYIVDGHHRVEASKEVGVEFLDAEIIEFKYH
ncbi:MAG TPA: ParB N-terminal domain-containing protein [Halanaerobiaceae bacterium]|jgi:hypothetical protein|nr:ParB/Srx family N-terminal domain-containing protein [Bacillota bacterium]HHU91776.1 ParB N-terminal domain-containing protein [Halanaerobiaceae bacterium]HOA40364.1 ParB/Srx family N-terminal domain-containing protein [Halanaerobiales bacterium]HPZ62863.1 ParB/Srx family N-terminal domain-containing protein [Halanaerobiales bacterium]HQD04236.1 ParB/Srx family N-terminal domain-containing protein [Halanaerobiales bacterium]